MKAAGLSHPGLVREKNEDAYLIDIERGLFLVADGLGGHPYGEVASQLAVQAVERFFIHNNPKSHPSPTQLLSEAVFVAHAVLQEAAYADNRLQGMGTTLLAAWLSGDAATLRLSHVGDSRAYLLRGGRLKQLTEDHTLLQRAIKSGLVSPEDEANLPSRHTLFQAVGHGDFVMPSALQIALGGDERLLLCTDGLTGEISDREIEAILSSSKPLGDICSDLIQAANRTGGADNVTVVVVDVA